MRNMKPNLSNPITVSIASYDNNNNLYMFILWHILLYPTSHYYHNSRICIMYYDYE